MSKELQVSIYGPIEAEIGACARKQFLKYGFDISDVKDERRVNLEPIFYEAGLPPESSLHDLFYMLKYDDKSEFDPQLIIDDLIEMRSYQIRKPMLKFLQRFRDDRAIEYVVDVHDAMLAVDQNMATTSHYIENYIDWKEKERSKEVANSRKKKEFQTKPYLFFDNGGKGLCIVLPRTILKDEWVEDVQWNVTGDEGFQIHKKVEVFGGEGQRYIDSIIIPVMASKSYVISLIDKEKFEDPVIIEWKIDGIQIDEAVFFNANGRMINAKYLMYPYCVMIEGKDVVHIDSKYIDIMNQSYPLDSPNYFVKTIEPMGKDARLTIRSKSADIVITTKPRIMMSFSGKTLFNMPVEYGWKIFTDIPNLLIEIEEGILVTGLELRIGTRKINIDDFFNNGVAIVSLKNLYEDVFYEFGTYSLRLYQNNRFLKQVEFSLTPPIKSTYNARISWPQCGKYEERKIKFEKMSNWEMDFSNCVTYSDEDNYIIEYQPNVGNISVILRSLDEQRNFSCSFELPVNPYVIDILDNISTLEEDNKKIKKIALSDMQNINYWVSIICFGEYKEKSYCLKVRTINGIEQVEKIRLMQNGCGQFNMAVFSDTLASCPLPAKIELWCDECEDMVTKIVTIVDVTHLKSRPVYSPKNQYISINADDNAQDITVKRFGVEKNEVKLLFEKSKLGKTKKGNPVRGYKCDIPLVDGLYYVESSNIQHGFEFEDEENVIISNETDTMYVSKREKEMPICTISDWLDILMRDILSCGVTKDIVGLVSYEWINKLQDLQGTIGETDYEKLIAIAYFVHGKCSNRKKNSLILCMRAISSKVLTAELRLELIRTLIKMRCSESIFDICIREYSLYLFSAGTIDAKVIADEVEYYSVELSMLIRMGIDDSIRDTIWRDKYRELIGKEAIKELLSVPGTEDALYIAENQKKFLREQGNCAVKINLTKEISGDMEPIQAMIRVTPKQIVFDISKKPDNGIYFARIRYVDQYVNWYCMTHDSNQEILPNIKKEMVETVQKYGADIIKYINELKSTAELKDIIVSYEKAIRARYSENPLSNMNACIPARYFYLQGLAAVLAKLPVEYKKYGSAVRVGEQFMINAMRIAPRISKRDLVMASTYIYLKRKEEKLCR